MEAPSTTTATRIIDKNVVDVSPFFHFEATGDSESSGGSDELRVPVDDDDAESCSWDSADRYCKSEIVDPMDGGDVVDRDCSNGDDYDEESDGCDRVDKVEVSSDPMCRTWSGGGATGARRKSEVSVDSTTKEFESLNEMEKDRLFWETCLAS